jgi:hypothetical protein
VASIGAVGPVLALRGIDVDVDTGMSIACPEAIGTVITDYRSTEGNQGGIALRRPLEDRVEFLMLTFWDSLESIKAFNGDDIAVAKYYDFDAEVLLEVVPNADHYEIYDD